MRRAVFLTLALAVSATAQAAPQPKRTVILLDESGSMKKNDPARLSLDAARLFAELSLDADQIAVVAFGDRPRVLVPMSPAKSRRTMKAVRKSLRRLKFDGRTTDIESGLNAALVMLGPTATQSRDTIVLITDGKVDLGPAADSAERASIERIRKQVAPTLAARNVRSYTIAFTPEADQSLMRGLARATRGEFRYLPHAAALAGAFAEMFTSASNLETLPMRDGAFITDPNIEKTSLVLSKGAPGDENTIRTPNDVVVTKSSNQAGVEWKSGDAYDHITLTKPQAGPWGVDVPPGAAPPVAMITASDLEFLAMVSPETPTEGEPILVRAELRRKGELTNSFELHDGLSVTAHVASEEGKERTLELKRVRDGGYEVKIDSLKAGRVGMFVRAQSMLIEREKRILLDVAPKPPPVPAAAAAATAEVTTVAGVWPYVAGGLGLLALLAIGFIFVLRGRLRAAAEALKEAEDKPPPPPEKEIVHKPVLLVAEDMQVLLPEGGHDQGKQTLEAIEAARQELAELTKCQESIQAAIDEIMNAAVSVTTGLGGLGGTEGLPDEIAERRDALVETMRTVDDQVGELCDGSMNLAEQIEKTNERISLVIQEANGSADPVLTHFEINEVIISRADGQTAEEYERLKQELLDQIQAEPELVKAREELETKVAEMASLQTQFDELNDKHTKTEVQLDEVTAEYQKIFAEVHG
ncbi:MAG: VWA domain-containing protein [Deltaproteobacteria bacterium]